ncbi:MAG: anthranilate synthase component I family protein [Bacteroidetes bacterium]|nr:anthranilate synthase component I family protein [Bacteroidota bacterium]
MQYFHFLSEHFFCPDHSSSKQNESLSLSVIKKLSYNILPTEFNINIEALNTRFERVCVFNSNLQTNKNNYLQTSRIIALGASQELIINKAENTLEQFQTFYDQRKGWLFGYLTYDLKNEIEQLHSENADGLAFPLLHFFAPKVVIQFDATVASVTYDNDFISEAEVDEIYNLAVNSPMYSSTSAREALLNDQLKKNNIESKITKQEYIDSVTQLKQHIRKGDIYEVNFCQEFFAENASINTVDTYEKLNAISQAPFTAYCKFGKQYLICASPERFLQKRSNTLMAQPIKGTTKRSSIKTDDAKLKQELQNSEKERSENVMIVDLVRNDLARIAKPGTVNVNELFGIYSFKQVHHMISTITCEMKETVSFTDIIKNTFPMGSMTGAPKVSAMKLIEHFESSKRGLYSGALGYIDPEGDFDFNVVIRSILYNEENKYLSFMVGSAITDKSDAEKEYEECLLKAKAMFEVLG